MELEFDNAFVRDLPGDAEAGSRVRQVQGAAYSRVVPTPVSNPRLLAVSDSMLDALGIPSAVAQTPQFARVFSGNELLPGMQPYAACYGGHQFGSWAGQLGDGRAISLGEVVSGGGRFELQLKGAGPTPYSRRADGRAVLRSSVREFLCSEAMFALGVPTTRALSLVATGDPVLRDMFYDGHPVEEPGAIVCRVAPSFIRFGTFELPSLRGDKELLSRLVRFTIARDFPDLVGSPEARFAHWFERVCVSTARLVAHWMRVGFVHGVLNTDNMSILGLTLDYGPYGFLDDYDPTFTPNTTDAGTRRYRYAAQPAIGHYNLSKLAQALSPLQDTSDVLVAGLTAYQDILDDAMQASFASKLGLSNREEMDDELVTDLLDLLTKAELDMTLFYRRLADLPLEEVSLRPFDEAVYSPTKLAEHGPGLLAWLKRYADRSLRQEPSVRAQRAERMNAANPAFLLRNYLVHEAIEAAEKGDLGKLLRLGRALREPYQETPEFSDLRRRRPEWARQKPGCSMLSCSS